MKHRVIIRKCTGYDADKIAGIIREGMQEAMHIFRGFNPDVDKEKT